MLKKKSLGQHFLRSKSHLGAVVTAGGVTHEDMVLEIGPGDGALTRELLITGARVVAIEKDSRLIPLLSVTFHREITSGQLQIIEGDALTFDPSILQTNTWKVVGNIPYYITGALIRTFLTCSPQPSTLVFLIQKEVAERIARSSKESLLSLSVKAYGTPTYVKTVPRGAFSPPPEVESAILSVLAISRKNFTSPLHEQKFFEVLHAGFAQKRKLLRRNVESALGSEAASKMEEAGIPQSARAEDVHIKEWLTLSRV